MWKEILRRLKCNLCSQGVNGLLGEMRHKLIENEITVKFREHRGTTTVEILQDSIVLTVRLAL